MRRPDDPFLATEVNCLDILNVFDEGVILADAGGVIRFYNDAMAVIDETRIEEVLGRQVTDVYQLTDKTSLIMVCLHTRRAIVSRHLVYKTRSGRLVNSLCSVFPLMRGRRLAGAACFVRDYNLLEHTVTSMCARAPREGVSPPAGAQPLHVFEDIVGGAPAFLQALRTARMAALTPSAVMLHGETGTGKELFAQAMHAFGPRKKEPYVAINCAAIPESLLEGILFGTVRGAFTGALDRAGLFEKAHRGTVFLDEVNAMPVGLQAKILRVLQERRVRRVGALEEREVDVKVVSSANEDPHEAIAGGRLRLDLFYRLGVVVIRLAPLRERRDDIRDLVFHAVRKHGERLGRSVAGVTPEVMELFRAYEWPGNVRELDHVIEGAMNVMGGHNLIGLADLPPHLARGAETKGARPAAPVSAQAVPADDDPAWHFRTRAERERRAVEAALREAGGNVSRAARILGISRQLLRYKLKCHGFSGEDFSGEG